MRSIIGVALIILGVILGLYVGVYLMLYLGIIQVIGALQGGVDAPSVAWGIVRILMAGFAGGLSFWVLFGLGINLIERDT
jgi:hypothetical protein